MRDYLLCASHLEEYFTSVDADTELLLAYIKYSAKEPLLRSSKTIKKWLNTYTDSHKYIHQFKSVSYEKCVMRHYCVVWGHKLGWYLWKCYLKIESILVKR